MLAEHDVERVVCAGQGHRVAVLSPNRCTQRRLVTPEWVGPTTEHRRYETLFMRFNQHGWKPVTPTVWPSRPANSSLSEVNPARPLSLKCCIAAKIACIDAVID